VEFCCIWEEHLNEVKRTWLNKKALRCTGATLLICDWRADVQSLNSVSDIVNNDSYHSHADVGLVADSTALQVK